MTVNKGQNIKDTYKRQQIKDHMSQIKTVIQSDVDFLNKKTERVGAAIMLMADLVKDNNEFVETIIKDTIDLVSRPVVLGGVDISSLSDLIDERFAKVQALRSLVQLGKLSGRFSPMNADIVRSEMREITKACDSILHQLFVGVPVTNANFSHQTTLEIPEEFFAVKRPTKTQEKEVKKDVIAAVKAPITEAVKKPVDLEKELHPVGKKVAPIVSPRKAQRSAQQERTVRIIGLLSRLGEASIKDITSEFSGVSEKTIQRDMARLTEEGKVKTEGKRRWTKYKLA